MHTHPTPTVLITGATDGIGLALARSYQARGVRLVLVGRRPRAALDQALFTPERYCQVDLTQADCADVVTRFLDEQAIAELSLLIHNAGVGYYGSVEQQPPENISELVTVNLRAPIALTHALLPRLRAARGKLVFISSVAAGLPVSEYAVYGATKAALDGFARSLRIELRDAVAVQVIHPGATRTSMHTKSGVPSGALKWERFPSPETTAERIAQAIADSRSSVTIGAVNRLLRFGGYYVPGIVHWFASRMRD
jgi:short-subunit dehydrogenase